MDQALPGMDDTKGEASSTGKWVNTVIGNEAIARNSTGIVAMLALRSPIAFWTHGSVAAILRSLIRKLLPGRLGEY
ncbi:hypothetical protein [Azospirillum soli]|uniref:hypothetical protein n=1 Tax=Azospirillum soli TaxID=1304799 RepID=UPI001AE2749A|nr:hypothetical protein [Azospirillum soli]MBP2311908.1 hypothetical protein [Azospirillum soli]